MKAVGFGMALVLGSIDQVSGINGDSARINGRKVRAVLEGRQRYLDTWCQKMIKALEGQVREATKDYTEEARSNTARVFEPVLSRLWSLRHDARALMPVIQDLVYLEDLDQLADRVDNYYVDIWERFQMLNEETKRYLEVTAPV